MKALPRIPAERAFAVALLGIGLITAVRVLVLLATPLQLYPDEAQYWWWAQHPDIGYFSKPPLIAWIVWLTTRMFGNMVWAIRLASPLLHAGTALIVYALSDRVGGKRLATWSALAYATLPGVAYSSGLISTDVPLLFCWALALLALLRALDEPGWRWTGLCGVAIGLGMLAKYAMLFFPIGALLAALFSAKTRRFLVSGRGLAVALIALVLLSPNLYWNWRHHFPTVGHTAADADWGSAGYSLSSALSFIGGQFGVFGPVLMVGFLVALWRLARSARRADDELVLAAMAIPPLLIMTVQGFISVANANWAATSYVSATPLAVMVLLQVPWALAASFALDLSAMLVLWVVLIWPGIGTTLGVANAFKREQGWRQLGGAITAAARAGHYDVIAVANRSVIAELTYYAPQRPIPLRAWDGNGQIADYFEMTMPLRPADRHVLLALLPEETRAVLPSFESSRLIGRIATPVGGGIRRIVLLYDARGYETPSAER